MTSEKAMTGHNQRTMYNPQYPKALIQFMQQNPKKSLAAFCNSIGVGYSTLKKWAEKHDEVAQAIELAVQYSLEYYEDVAHDQATGDNHGKSSSLQFIMKNRFRDFYKDRQEVEHNTSVVFHIETGIKRPGDEGFIELDQKDFRNIKEVPVEILPNKKDSDLL